ncbi:hypothetical protein WJX75_003611 [Coccomyxa subellipsoidea]|uniref:Condensin complex subunit 2 n=1 Tax=Coccomyxa subellipsoidea TaxID=248742 RepID=A0ABR2Z333_9CHLO
MEFGGYMLHPDDQPQRERAGPRPVAEQSLSQDAWARFPERSEEQPGGFHGFDFASERSMLHAHNLRAAQHAEAGGGRKRPAEEGGPGGGSGGGDGGTLPDAKAVLRGQRWKLPRVRSLGFLPSDDALLAQAATWPGSGAPGSEDGSANLHGLRIRTLDLGATAAADAANDSSNAEAPARVNNGSASKTALPLSHGSLNAFNPFEGGSEFMLSPLRRRGDNQGDIAGAEGSPPAHGGFSPFGLVAELRFTPTPPLDMGAPLETGAAE